MVSTMTEWTKHQTPTPVQTSIMSQRFDFEELIQILMVNSHRPVSCLQHRLCPCLFPSMASRALLAAFRCTHLQSKCAVPCVPSYFGREVMADIQGIDAQQTHTKAKSNQALLVCAYEDEAKCRRLNLDGSISFANFKSRVNSLPKSQEIIFY
jgi:hypothetical protein